MFYKEHIPRMRKAVFALLLLFLFTNPAYSQTKFDENGCKGFANTSGDITTLIQMGASEGDIIRMFKESNLDAYPYDVQRLARLLLKFIIVFSSKEQPSENVTGALILCRNAGGDVSRMIDAFEKVLKLPRI